MSRKTTSNTSGTSTTQTQMDPWVTQAGQQNYQMGQEAVANWSPIQRETPAGFTDFQNRAFQMVDQAPNGSSPLAQQALQAATDTNAKLANFSAPTVGTHTYTPYTTSDARMAQLMAPISNYSFMNPGEAFGGISFGGGGGAGAVTAASVPDVIAQQIKAAEMDRSGIRDVESAKTYEQLQQYLNMIDPMYAESVLNPALNDIDRTRQMQLQQNASAAAAAGAFGGSRHGVVEAETNRAALDAGARTAGDLRMGMFDKALSSLQADLGRQLQADTSNQGMDYNTLLQNAQLLQQANIANQGADLTAQQGNQSTRAQLSVANANNAQSAANVNASAANAAAAQRASLMAQFLMQNENNRAQFARDMVSQGFGAEQNNGGWMNQAGQFNAGQATTADQYNAQNAINTAMQVWKPAVENYRGIATDQNAQFQQGLTNLLDMGDKQQAYNQSVLDNNYNNAMGQNLAPLTRVMMLQQMLANSPYNTSVTSTNDQTTTQKQNMGWQDLAGLGLEVLSDERLKEDVKPMKNPLNSLRKMQGVDYAWKDGGRDHGLLAQDVGRAIPGGTVDMGGGKLGYSVPKVLGLLTESVKALDSKVNSKRKRK